MRETCDKEVQIKAAGGVRSLDMFLYMMHSEYLGSGRRGQRESWKRPARGGSGKTRCKFLSSRRVALKGGPAGISSGNILCGAPEPRREPHTRSKKKRKKTQIQLEIQQKSHVEGKTLGSQSTTEARVLAGMCQKTVVAGESQALAQSPLMKASWPIVIGIASMRWYTCVKFRDCGSLDIAVYIR